MTFDELCDFEEKLEEISDICRIILSKRIDLKGYPREYEFTYGDSSFKMIFEYNDSCSCHPEYQTDEQWISTEEIAEVYEIGVDAAREKFRAEKAETERLAKEKAAAEKLEREAKAAREREAKERAELERLKAKFENV